MLPKISHNSAGTKLRRKDSYASDISSPIIRRQRISHSWGVCAALVTNCASCYYRHTAHSRWSGVGNPSSARLGPRDAPRGVRWPRQPDSALTERNAPSEGEAITRGGGAGRGNSIEWRGTATQLGGKLKQ